MLNSSSYKDNIAGTEQFFEGSSKSDLKIGQFSRVKSPIIDLIQSVERTVKNKNASDRVKAANAVTLAAQGYQLADTVMKTLAQQDGLAYLVRVESGTGVAHSRQSQAREAQLSQGNVFNGKQLHFTATGTGEELANGERKLGNIHLTQSELTSRDEQGNRIKDSQLNLTAYDTTFTAGKSHSKEKMRGQNVGVEVGMFAQAGPQTGVGVYATVGGGSQKMDAERTTYHNSHLDSEQITFNTQNDLTLQGTTAKASRIDANVGGKLHIESLQDVQTLKSKSNQAGLSVSISFGNAWGGNLGFSADRASENYRQVIEQSGLFAEAGGYHINANHVHLKGGVIASQNGENSELATNQLTAEDIQNHSSSQAMSGGASFGMSHKEGHFEEKGTGKVVKNPEASNLDTNNLKWVNESTSPSPNLGIPMYESHHDSSVTKATITAGKITLNKDSQPIHTTVEALAKTLNINTALDEANQQVEKAKDTQTQLQEQKILRDAVGNLQSAMATYTANQAKAAELEAERLEQDIAREQDTQKLQQKTTALLNARDTQKQWSDGGSYKRTLDTATTIASGLLAGQSSTQIATTLASPYLNQQIKRFTTDEKGEVNLLTNTLAHAILGAAEAAANNGNIASGAIAASTSELAAPVFTQLLGKTHANQLNSDERQTVTTLSSLVGALTAGLTAQQTSSTNNTVGILNAAALGGEIGKRAVENNYLYAFEAERKAELDILIQTETDPEKRKAYEAERAAIIKRDIDRQQAIEASCQRFNKGSAGCASQIAEANRAKASYSASTDLIRGVGMQRDKRRYADLFKNDFYRVNEALQGKDPVTVQKEAFAIEVSKAKNTRPEDEYTWISNGIDLGWLGEYQGWGRSIKGLPKSGNFATKVPKEANANDKLSVIGKTENYENQTSKIHISSGAENVALYPKLKEQLMKENIINIGKLDPTLQEVTSKLGSKLDYGIDGMRSVSESNRLGMLWVGENPTVIKERGKVIGLMSNDGTRHYRFPADKPKARLSVTKFQSNFETYKFDPISKNRIKIGNAHLDINKE